jgi:hypothetical protein
MSTYDFKLHLAYLVDRHQDLSANGWRFENRTDSWNTGANFDRSRSCMKSEDFELQVRDVTSWIRKNPSKILKTGSYGLKHHAEKAAGRYCSNGAAIVAALMLGYQIKREGTGLNCEFGPSTAVVDANQAWDLYQNQKTLEEWEATVEPEVAEYCIKKHGSLPAAHDDFRGCLLDIVLCALETRMAWDEPVQGG